MKPTIHGYSNAAHKSSALGRPHRQTLKARAPAIVAARDLLAIAEAPIKLKVKQAKPIQLPSQQHSQSAFYPIFHHK